MPCQPTPADHCCWVDGTVCPFFDAETPDTDRRCTLRLELGDWALVHVDGRYLETVKPAWERAGIPNCGDWTPSPVNPCSQCGWDGT